MDYAHTKPKAYESMDLLQPGQVAAAIGALKAMLDPVARAIAPVEDQPVKDKERRNAAAARASFELGEGIPEFLAGFGLSAEDFDRMRRTPREANRTAH